MFKLAKHNKNISVSSGTTRYLSMKNEVRKMKNKKGEEQAELTDSIEWIQNVYSGTEIDIKDTSGIYLMNSGYNLTSPHVVQTVDPGLTKIISNMKELGVFEQLASKTTSSEEIMWRAVDLNGKINVTTNQKTRTMSSIADVKASYDTFNKIRANKGKIYWFDTETIGGKNQHGIWNPLGITEFAMQEYDFSSNTYKKTNIMMGIAPTEENLTIYDKIVELLEYGAKTGDYSGIEQNAELKVTAMRMGLYHGADIQYDKELGYSVIHSLPGDHGDWKSVDVFKSGWKKNVDAYKTAKIGKSGMKITDEMYFHALQVMNENLSSGNAVLANQNIQVFDMAQVNTEMLRKINMYKDISLGKRDIGHMGSSIKDTYITRQGAKDATDYAQSILDNMGGGFNPSNETIIDTMPIASLIRDYFGINALYNGNQEMIKKAGGSSIRQEYIGEAYFPEPFKTAAAHMADFDVDIQRMFFTEPVEQLGGLTVMDYFMGAAGPDGTGIYGINDTTTKIKTGDVYHIKKGTSRTWEGRGLLNFTYNSRTKETYLSSGHQIVDGNLRVPDPGKPINMGTELKKGQYYRLENVHSVKTSDLADKLGLTLPDMSGSDVIVAQFKMQLPEGVSGGIDDDLVYVQIFNSEKELSGYLSSSAQLALERQEDGSLKINSNAKDLFERADITPQGDLAIKPGTEAEKINETLSYAFEGFKTDKANRNIINNEKAYGKYQKIREASKFLEANNLNGVTGEEFELLMNGKTIRNLDDKAAKVLNEGLVKIFNYQDQATGNYILHSNTIRANAQAWNWINSKDKFFDNMLIAFDKFSTAKKMDNYQKKVAFNDFQEVMRQYAAALLDTDSPVDSKTTRGRVRNTKKYYPSMDEIKKTFDIEMPIGFNIDNKHSVSTSSMSNPQVFNNVIRINPYDDSQSYNLVSGIRKQRYGTKDFGSSTDYHDRLAFSSFIEHLSNEEDFKGLLDPVYKVTKEKDYNVNQAARELMKVMTDIKEKTPGAHIIKPFEYQTLDSDILTKPLNELPVETMEALANKYVPVPVNTHSLLEQKNGMLDYINNNVMKHYMPNKQEFLTHLTSQGFSKNEIWVKEKLYDSLHEDISKQINDIVTMASKVTGINTYISSSGDIVLDQNGNSIILDSIPKVISKNGHLVGKLGNQELNLNLKINYDKSGKGKISSNLGEKFAQYTSVSKNIQRLIDTGEFKGIDDFLYYSKKLSKDFLESLLIQELVEIY